MCLSDARRADIESFARELEVSGRARARVTRRLWTVAAFYRYAVAAGAWIAHRRPMSADRGWIARGSRRDWTATGSPRGWSPTRVARRPSTPWSAGLNGPPVSEAGGADTEAFGTERVTGPPDHTRGAARSSPSGCTASPPPGRTTRTALPSAVRPPRAPSRLTIGWNGDVEFARDVPTHVGGLPLSAVANGHCNPAVILASGVGVHPSIGESPATYARPDRDASRRGARSDD